MALFAAAGGCGLVGWLALAGLAAVCCWLGGGAGGGFAVGFCTHGRVFVVGAADGEFWRGAAELVVGDLGKISGVGKDVA